MRTDPSFKGILDLTPGAVNQIKEKGVEPIESGRPMDIGSVEQKIAATQHMINQTYYTDLFLMIAQADISGRNVTATEINERHEEKLIMLGPVIERQIFELLQPTVFRVFNILLRSGLLPPAPEEIQGQPIKVEFVSVLAQAQKLVSANSLNAYVAMAERVGQLDQGSLAKTDWDKFLEVYGDTVGVSAEVIRSDEEVQDVREREALARQKEAQTQDVERAAKVMKDMGDASTESGTALNDLKSAVEG